LKNRTLLVVGYGSLLSGYGMLAHRRGGGSRLVAREAFAVSIHNARRGLAKPSSHGSYLAMDLEPIDRRKPITARADQKGAGMGAIALVFDREWAPRIARREEYSPEKFVELIEIADRAGKPLGEFLLEIAGRVNFDLLDYRRALFELLGYTSPGYIFHPMPLDRRRVAIVAIGSGYEGSGDPALPSRRNECGMDRLLRLGEAIKLDRLEIDREGQIGYLVEAILGGLHGLGVADLMEGIGVESELGQQVARHFTAAAAREHAFMLEATGLSASQYRESFGAEPDLSLKSFLAGNPGGLGNLKPR
jgi:hypothetical protein